VRLLVTRPEPEAQATAERLRALGHTVAIAPLLAVVFAPPPDDAVHPAAILVTSRNGVRALAGWPQLAGWLERPLFAVGDATALAARIAGFAHVRSAGGNGAALAALVRDALPPAGGPLLYVAARERAGDLAAALAAEGYDVRVAEAYHAEKATQFPPDAGAALAAGRFDGALFYSRRTAEAFRDLAAGGTVRLPHVFALSEEVAAPLADLGVVVHVAAVPDEAHLLALVPKA
jgi:uroporphyrinogen-III synthase